MTQPAYLDPSLPIPERIQDLLSRLTLDEKLGQFLHPANAVPRLGIPAYNYWNEGLHGVGRNGRATVFPQAIGMSATWNPSLVREIASAIGDEARAKFHETLRAKGHTDIYQGLTFWSPNINIFRDPRWGRGQETWGEDPTLTGEMGAAFVRGLQGDHPKYLKAAACAKHYAVHSGPEKFRHSFNVTPGRRDLYDTYLPAFKKLVTEANVEAVMGAYNRVLDEPCCASRLLLQEILREEWGFEGHVVSDCWALSDFHTGHGVTKNPLESAVLALKAGCDISCGCTYDYLGEALEKGLISEADLDCSLTRTLATRFKLGLFDPPEDVPYAATPMSVVACKKHRDLAYRVALQSAVLLKNRNNILPIKPDIGSIFVTGPAAASLDVLLGNYYGLNDQMTTLLEGIVGRLPEGIRLEYRSGCQWTQESLASLNYALLEAASADLVIVCAGTSPLMEGEEGESILTAEFGDRERIELPPNQQKFIRELVEGGSRIVLVLTGGSPIALGEIAEMVDAILFVWYPGQEGGRAVASLLFGDASPGGKLTLTFPQSTDDLPPFDDYSMTGRTYRYSAKEPLFPFGFGLSYTTFSYSDLKISTPRASGFKASITVTNSGDATGDEVVQFYLSVLESCLPAPIHKLVGFRRITLKPGKSRTIRLAIKPEMLMLVNEDGRQVLASGKFRLAVGGCSPGVRGLVLGADEPVSVEFKI